jgi:RNA polymerase sigma-70 factor, ECF subfamily
MAIASTNVDHSSGDSNQAFERLAEPFRREIKAHCYRLMGSLHEAEDMVQETYLRAWRGFSSFDGVSMRAWLYKIATNACLNALEKRKHQQRFLPHQLGPSGPPVVGDGPALDVPWLEPYPDINLEGIADTASNPEARYSSRESVKLAFVAAIQELPPRQRAALLLCDVLGWTAPEAATLLGGSTASVNSALQRARGAFSQHSEGWRPLESEPNSAQLRLLRRYLQAWEGHNVDSFVALLKEDATAIMPPWLQWFTGRHVIGAFFAAAWKTCGGLRLIPTAANGQPAFAVYEFSLAEKCWNAHSIHVLSVENEAITTITLFLNARLFRDFGLPRFLHQNSAISGVHGS